MRQKDNRPLVWQGSAEEKARRACEKCMPVLLLACVALPGRNQQATASKQHIQARESHVMSIIKGLNFHATSSAITGTPTSWKAVGAPLPGQYKLPVTHGVSLASTPTPLQTSVAQLGHPQQVSVATAITTAITAPPTASLNITTGSSTLDATVGSTVGVGTAIYRFVTAPVRFVANNSYLAIPPQLRPVTDLLTHPDVKQTLSDLTGGATDRILDPLKKARDSSEVTVAATQQFFADPLPALGRAMDHVVDSTSNNPLETIGDYSRYVQTVTTGFLFASPFLGWNVTKLPLAAAPRTAAPPLQLTGPTSTQAASHTPTPLPSAPSGGGTALLPAKVSGPFAPNPNGVVSAGNMLGLGLPSRPIALGSNADGISIDLANYLGQETITVSTPLNGLNTDGHFAAALVDDLGVTHPPKDPSLPETVAIESLLPGGAYSNTTIGHYPGVGLMSRTGGPITPAELATLGHARRAEFGWGDVLTSTGFSTRLAEGSWNRLFANPGYDTFFRPGDHFHADGNPYAQINDQLSLLWTHQGNTNQILTARLPNVATVITDKATGEVIRTSYGPYHDLSQQPKALDWSDVVAPGHTAPTVQYRPHIDGTATIRLDDVSAGIDVAALRKRIHELGHTEVTVEVNKATSSSEALEKIKSHDQFDFETKNGQVTVQAKPTDMHPFTEQLRYDFTKEGVYAVEQQRYTSDGHLISATDPNTTRMLTWKERAQIVDSDGNLIKPTPIDLPNKYQPIPLASNFKLISPQDQARAKSLQEVHLKDTQRLQDDATYWAGLDGDTVRVIQKPAAVAGESTVSLSEATIAMLRQAQETNVQLRDLELILPDGLPGITTSSLNATELSKAFALTDTGRTLIDHGFQVRHVLPLPGVDTGNNLLVQLRIPHEIPSGISPATAAASPTLQTTNGWSWPTNNTIERKNVPKTIAGEQAQAHIATLPVNAPLTMVDGLGSTLGRYLSDNPQIQQLSLYVPQNSALGRHLQGPFTKGSDVKQTLGQRFGNEADRLVSLDHQLKPLYGAGWDATAAKRVSDSQGNPGYSFQFRRAQVTPTTIEAAHQAAPVARVPADLTKADTNGTRQPTTYNLSEIEEIVRSNIQYADLYPYRTRGENYFTKYTPSVRIQEHEGRTIRVLRVDTDSTLPKPNLFHIGEQVTKTLTKTGEFFDRFELVIHPKKSRIAQDITRSGRYDLAEMSIDDIINASISYANGSGRRTNIGTIFSDLINDGWSVLGRQDDKRHYVISFERHKLNAGQPNRLPENLSITQPVSVAQTTAVSNSSPLVRWPTDEFMTNRSGNELNVWFGRSHSKNKTLQNLPSVVNQVLSDDSIGYLNINFSMGSAIGTDIQDRSGINSILKISGLAHASDTTIGRVLKPLLDQGWGITVNEVPGKISNLGYQLVLSRDGTQAQPSAKPRATAQHSAITQPAIKKSAATATTAGRTTPARSIEELTRIARETIQSHQRNTSRLLPDGFLPTVDRGNNGIAKLTIVTGDRMQPTGIAYIAERFDEFMQSAGAPIGQVDLVIPIDSPAGMALGLRNSGRSTDDVVNKRFNIRVDGHPEKTSIESRFYGYLTAGWVPSSTYNRDRTFTLSFRRPTDGADGAPLATEAAAITSTPVSIAKEIHHALGYDTGQVYRKLYALRITDGERKIPVVSNYGYNNMAGTLYVKLGRAGYDGTLDASLAKTVQDAIDFSNAKGKVSRVVLVLSEESHLFSSTNKFLQQSGSEVQTQVQPGSLTWADEGFSGWEISRVERTSAYKANSASDIPSTISSLLPHIPEQRLIAVELKLPDSVHANKVDQLLAQQKAVDEIARREKARDRIQRSIPVALNKLDAAGVRYLSNDRVIEYSMTTESGQLVALTASKKLGHGLRNGAKSGEYIRGSAIAFTKPVNPTQADELAPYFELFDHVMGSHPGIFKVDVQVRVSDLPKKLKNLLFMTQEQINLLDTRSWKASVTRALKQTALGRYVSDFDFKRGLMRQDLGTGMVTLHFLMDSRAARVQQAQGAMKEEGE